MALSPETNNIQPMETWPLPDQDDKLLQDEDSDKAVEAPEEAQQMETKETTTEGSCEVKECAHEKYQDGGGESVQRTEKQDNGGCKLHTTLKLKRKIMTRASSGRDVAKKSVSSDDEVKLQSQPLSSCESCSAHLVNRSGSATNGQRQDEESCSVCKRRLSTSSDQQRHEAWHSRRGKRKIPTPSRIKQEAEVGSRRVSPRKGRGPTRCGCCGEQFSGRALRDHFAPHPRTSYYQCSSCGDAFGQACQLERHVCADPVRLKPPSSPEPGNPCPATRGPGRPRKRRATSPRPPKVKEEPAPSEESGNKSTEKKEKEEGQKIKDVKEEEKVKEEVERPSSAAEGNSDTPALNMNDLAWNAVDTVMDSTPDNDDFQDPDFHYDDHDGSHSEEDEEEDAMNSATYTDHQETLPHPCTLCDRQFSSARNLRRHDRTHLKDRPLECELCGNVYSRPDSLSRHTMLTHKQERTLPCTHCRWKFTQQGLLDYHLLLHDQGQKLRKERKPRCRICKSNFTTVEELETHTCTGPPSGARYVCDICGKSIKTKEWLHRHRLLHEDDRPAKCEQCDRGFIDDKALQLHMKSHTDGKRFLCDVCGKGFALKVTLQTHTRIHTGEKPFVCKTCGKPFTTRTQLFHHSKIHSGEKPYACNVCGRAFRQSHHLKTHMKVHPGDKDGASRGSAYEDSRQIVARPPVTLPQGSFSLSASRESMGSRVKMLGILPGGTVSMGKGARMLDEPVLVLQRHEIEQQQREVQHIVEQHHQEEMQLQQIHERSTGSSVTAFIIPTTKQLHQQELHEQPELIVEAQETIVISSPQHHIHAEFDGSSMGNGETVMAVDVDEAGVAGELGVLEPNVLRYRM